MKAVKFTQSQIAIITAVCIALSHPFPANLPRWDGHNINIFKATKDTFTADQKGAKRA